MEAKSELLIIGAGVIGLSCAFEAKRKGIDFLLLDKRVPGSYASAGDKRIFRNYHLDQTNIKLAKQARKDWLELEEEFKTELLKKSGHMFLASEENMKIVKENNLSGEILSTKEITNGFPYFKASQPMFLDTDGAIIDSRKTIELLSAEAKNNTLLSEVKLLEKKSNYFLVYTGYQKIKANQIIVAAGSASKDLVLPLGLNLPTPKETYHFRPTIRLNQLNSKGLNSMPAISFKTDKPGKESFYGLPIDKDKIAIGLPFPSGSSLKCFKENDEEFIRLCDKTLATAKEFFSVEEITNWTPCPSISLDAKQGGSDGHKIALTKGAAAILGGNLFKFAPTLGKRLIKEIS